MNTPQDPRLGNQRKNALLQKIAQQAVQRRRLGGMGRFGGRLSNRHGAVRSLISPGRGVAQHGLRAAAPSMLPGLGGPFGNPHAKVPAAVGLGGPRVAAAAPRPQSLEVNSPIPGVGTITSQQPYVGADGGNPGPGEQGYGFGNDVIHQEAPSGQLTVGGLIPLGGGMYLDPQSGQLLGGGGHGHVEV